MGYGRIFPPNSSGIRIIIVGCGFAGLSCAIESVRKGHKVIVLEKHKEVKMVGDVSLFFSIVHWGDLTSRLSDVF